MNPIAMRKLVSSMIEQAISRAVTGDPYEMLWLASNDAKFYFESLDMDRAKYISNVIRNYLQMQPLPRPERVKKWNARLEKARQETTIEIHNEAREARAAVRV